MTDEGYQTIRIEVLDYQWLWEQRKPKESFAETFSRIRAELEKLREVK
jgi:hypothetical protein